MGARVCVYVCVSVCACVHCGVSQCVCVWVCQCMQVCVCAHNVCVSACHSVCQLIILWTEKAAQYKTYHHILRPSCPKLQALVYYILPYAIGPRKLSANEQFFVDAQTVVTLLQTTQIISEVCLYNGPCAYTSSNKTKIVWIETELFFYPGWKRLVFMCMLGR